MQGFNQTQTGNPILSTLTRTTFYLENLTDINNMTGQAEKITGFHMQINQEIYIICKDNLRKIQYSISTNTHSIDISFHKLT